MRLSKYISLTLLLLVVSSSLASAPSDFGRVTTIDGINLESQQIIIGDRTYKLHSGISVRNFRNSELMSFNQLAIGTKVGCEITEDGYISEIWVLPENYEAVERND